jgi:dihydrofolate reductase
MRAMIWAESPEGILGVGGAIPWRYPGDLRRFKRLTLGSTVIMGRKTFESMGRALPGRRNLVVTSHAIEVAGIETARSLEEALERAGERPVGPGAEGGAAADAPRGGEGGAGPDIWFIGGARIYAGAMPYADLIDVTHVPDRIEAPDAVMAPPIDEGVFEASPLVAHEDEPRLMRRTYRRRAGR